MIQITPDALRQCYLEEKSMLVLFDSQRAAKNAFTSVAIPMIESLGGVFVPASLRAKFENGCTMVFANFEIRRMRGMRPDILVIDERLNVDAIRMRFSRVDAWYAMPRGWAIGDPAGVCL